MSFRLPRPAAALLAVRLLLVPVAVATLALTPARGQDEGSSSSSADGGTAQITIENKSDLAWTLKPVTGSSPDGHWYKNEDSRKLELSSKIGSKEEKLPMKGWTLSGKAKTLTVNVKNVKDSKTRAVHFKLVEGDQEVTFGLFAVGQDLKLFLEKAKLKEDFHTGQFELNQPQGGGLTITNINK